MAINSRLYDARGRPLKSIVRNGDALPVVATTPAILPAFKHQRFEETLEGGTEMAIDGAVGGGGSDEDVWNGDDTLWTRTQSCTASVTTGSAHSGTNGLDITDMDTNEYLRFDKGSTLVASDYTALSFWVNGQRRTGALYVRFENGSGVTVSNSLDVRSYITWSNGNWQQVAIPLADFAITDLIRYIRLTGGRNNSRFWFDDMVLSAAASSGGSKTFRIQPLIDVCFEVHGIELTLVAGDSGWAYDAFATIAGGLSAGLLVRHFDVVTGETYFQYNLLDNRDLLGRLSKVDSTALDSNLILLTLRLDLSITYWPQVIRNSVMDIVVRDNLSTLTSLTAWAIGGEHRGYFEGSTTPGVTREESEVF